jgi:prevent-host-death family protein
MLDDGTPQSRTWKLQDAKARFSEVVRAARAEGPQHVTLHGRDAVVVLSAEDYAKLADRPLHRMRLTEVMQACPVPEFEFEFPSERLPVRDVEP